MVRFSRGRDSPLRRSVQIGSAAQQAFYSIGGGEFFPESRAMETWTWPTTHLHLVPSWEAGDKLNLHCFMQLYIGRTKRCSLFSTKRVLGNISNSLFRKLGLLHRKRPQSCNSCERHNTRTMHVTRPDLRKFLAGLPKVPGGVTVNSCVYAEVNCSPLPLHVVAISVFTDPVSILSNKTSYTRRKEQHC